MTFVVVVVVVVVTGLALHTVLRTPLRTFVEERIILHLHYITTTVFWPASVLSLRLRGRLRLYTAEADTHDDIDVSYIHLRQALYRHYRSTFIALAYK